MQDLQARATGPSSLQNQQQTVPQRQPASLQDRFFMLPPVNARLEIRLSDGAQQPDIMVVPLAQHLLSPLKLYQQ